MQRGEAGQAGQQGEARPVHREDAVKVQAPHGLQPRQVLPKAVQVYLTAHVQLPQARGGGGHHGAQRALQLGPRATRAAAEGEAARLSELVNHHPVLLKYVITVID